MAAYKGKPRKRRSGIIAVRLDSALALATLTNATALTTALSPSENVEGNSLYCISADLLLSLDSMTPGEGPIIVGCNHDSYSVTQIKEFLESDALDFTNKLEIERSRRQIREWGVFAVAVSGEVLNDGKPLRVRIRFPVELGHSPNIFAFNKSGATLTTGGRLGWSGKMYVRRM